MPINTSQYKNQVIYYFSGTGNSQNVARWMSEEARCYHIESKLVDISQTNRRTIEPPPPETLIIFISPIHGFNYPPIMLHFIRHFPNGTNNVVLMNTRAGMLIGKHITPGITGVAFYLSSFLLLLKGYSIKAFFPVDLPSNWISIHPCLNARTVNFLHDKNKERITRFAARIYTGKNDFRSVREVYDLFLLPIAFSYYFIGRFFFAKTFYASADCNHCNKCIHDCPVKAIIQIDHRPYWTFRCESCMKCMSSCPQNAIQTAHGAVIQYMVIFFAALLGIFYQYFDRYFFEIQNGILKMAIESILFLTVFAAWYRILHYLLRYRWVERFMVYTSLTHYKFWGNRYRALNNK